jgi:hypothetical protein
LPGTHRDFEEALTLSDDLIGEYTRTIAIVSAAGLEEYLRHRDGKEG